MPMVTETKYYINTASTFTAYVKNIYSLPLYLTIYQTKLYT